MVHDTIVVQVPIIVGEEPPMVTEATSLVAEEPVIVSEPASPEPTVFLGEEPVIVGAPPAEEDNEDEFTFNEESCSHGYVDYDYTDGCLSCAFCGFVLEDA